MDDAEARAILREHGEDPPARGKLGEHWHSLAASFTGGGPADDYEPGVSAEDFTLDDTEPEPEAVNGQVVPPERRPRRPVRPKVPLRERIKGGQRDGKAKKKATHRRVPVDALISRGWELLGGLAGRVDPPVGRVLTMQAPVAGLVLEDVVRGTAADKVLQPLARAEDKAEKVLALAGPPVIVAAIEAAQRLPEEQMQMRLAILLPLLEESMVLWVRIAGDARIAERMAERDAEAGPARAQVRELIAMIFPQPAPPQPEPETVPA